MKFRKKPEWAMSNYDELVARLRNTIGFDYDDFEESLMAAASAIESLQARALLSVAGSRMRIARRDHDWLEISNMEQRILVALAGKDATC